MFVLLFRRMEAVGRCDAAGPDSGRDAQRRQREVLDDGGQAGVGPREGRTPHGSRVQGPVD